MLMKVVVHIEDARYNGIRPSHFDGIRMACTAYAVEELEYVDLTEDGWYAPGGQARHASFADFVAAHPGESVSLLDPAGTAFVDQTPDGWLVVGPSGGHDARTKTAYAGFTLDLPVAGALEGRDALMLALAGL